MKKYLNDSGRIALGTLAVFYGLVVLTMATAAYSDELKFVPDSVVQKQKGRVSLLTTAQYLGGGLAGAGLLYVGIGAFGLHKVRTRQKLIVQAKNAMTDVKTME